MLLCTALYAQPPPPTPPFPPTRAWCLEQLCGSLLSPVWFPWLRAPRCIAPHAWAHGTRLVCFLFIQRSTTIRAMFDSKPGLTLRGKQQDLRNTNRNELSGGALCFLVMGPVGGWWMVVGGVGGGWWLVGFGSWRMAVGGWWMVVGGVGGGWWPAVGGWWGLAVGGWRMVVPGGCP